MEHIVGHLELQRPGRQCRNHVVGEGHLVVQRQVAAKPGIDAIDVEVEPHARVGNGDLRLTVGRVVPPAVDRGAFRRGTVGSSAYRRSRVNTTNPSWRLTLMAECTPGAEPLKRWVT
ncbi:MAG: hypothetical protein ACJ74F_19275 [Mycobacterium sp.]